MEERVFAVLFDESISELDIEIVEERERDFAVLFE